MALVRLQGVGRAAVEDAEAGDVVRATHPQQEHRRPVPAAEAEAEAGAISTVDRTGAAPAAGEGGPKARQSISLTHTLPRSLTAFV